MYRGNQEKKHTFGLFNQLSSNTLFKNVAPKGQVPSIKIRTCMQLDSSAVLEVLKNCQK